MLRFRDISTLVPLESAGDSRKLSYQTASRSGSIYRIALTGAIAGLLFGFDTAVINGALLSLRVPIGRCSKIFLSNGPALRLHLSNCPPRRNLRTTVRL